LVFARQTVLRLWIEEKVRESSSLGGTLAYDSECESNEASPDWQHMTQKGIGGILGSGRSLSSQFFLYVKLPHIAETNIGLRQMVSSYWLTVLKDDEKFPADAFYEMIEFYIDALYQCKSHVLWI
jgi:hypothetical protein